MLQIISGKFFRTPDRHAFEAYGILYSNVAIWTSVETPVATIHPVDPHGSVARYVVSYTNQIEKGAGPIRTGDSEIIDQLALLASFGFRGFFSPSRNEVEQVCRAQRATSGDYVPSQLVDRFCDPRVTAENEDISRFKAFVDSAIGLRRGTYVEIIEYLKNFVGSLRAIDENLDLAYSMLIYGLEALSQRFSKFEPTWEGIEAKVRDRIDSILTDDPARLAAVREALLQSMPTRIQERLVAFIQGSLPDDYFIGVGLKGRNLPLRYSDLRRAVRNAYRVRSGFVHELKRGKQLNATFAEWDVLKRQNEPLLSFRGLARMAEAVARHVVATQEKVLSEDVDWQSGLPGRVTAELAPQYWIWRADVFRPQHARQRLSGFLSQLEEGQVTDLRDLLVVLADHILKLRGSVADRRAMATLYRLYHGVLREDDLQPNDDVMRMSDELLEQPCIESLLMTLILGRPWKWGAERTEQAIGAYQTQKFGKLGLTLGAQLEAGLLAFAGNQWREAGERERTQEWLRRSLLELSGHREKQRYVEKCREDNVAVDLSRLIKP
jgi:hypothetical protein